MEQKLTKFKSHPFHLNKNKEQNNHEHFPKIKNFETLLNKFSKSPCRKICLLTLTKCLLLKEDNMFQLKHIQILKILKKLLCKEKMQSLD